MRGAQEYEAATAGDIAGPLDAALAGSEDALEVSIADPRHDRKMAKLGLRRPVSSGARVAHRESSEPSAYDADAAGQRRRLPTEDVVPSMEMRRRWDAAHCTPRVLTEGRPRRLHMPVR